MCFLLCRYNLAFKSDVQCKSDDSEKKSPAEMVAFFQKMCEGYPMVLLEDPFDEEAFDTHAELTAQIGKEVEIVGDDIYCTNVSRVQVTYSFLHSLSLFLFLTHTFSP